MSDRSFTIQTLYTINTGHETLQSLVGVGGKGYDIDPVDIEFGEGEIHVELIASHYGSSLSTVNGALDYANSLLSAVGAPQIDDINIIVYGGDKISKKFGYSFSYQATYGLPPATGFRYWLNYKPEPTFAGSP